MLDAAMSLPLPPLSRESLLRIDQGEKDAKARYEAHTESLWPTNPTFSYLPADVYRSFSQIVECIRVYAEEVLDVHLKEYLESFPMELVMHIGLRARLADTIMKLTNQLWVGYRAALWIEPIAARARYAGNVAARNGNPFEERGPSRYPGGQAWTDFWRQVRLPDSEMALLKQRYDQTIHQAIFDRVKHYEDQAVSRLGLSRQSTTAVPGGENFGWLFPLPSVEPESTVKSDSVAGNGPAVAVTRKAWVDGFIAACKRECDFKVQRKHIWLAAGHRTGRQFAYWQANSPKASKTDHQNFVRILSMKPAEFVALLRERGIV